MDLMKSGLFDSKLIRAMLLIGFAYYFGAWLGVHQTITPEGIAILWPPNAILLAAFLIYPYRFLPFLALAAVIAELIAAIPAFPFWAAISFALINIFSVSLAALLIRRVAGENFNFNSLRNGGYFLLFAPLISATIAGLLGAGIYMLLARTESSYISIWQLWWFGDALAMLILTPMIVVLWRNLEQSKFRLHWPKLAEALIFWLIILAIGLQGFSRESGEVVLFYYAPIWLILIGILSALRLGVLGATTTVAFIAVIAVALLMQGIYPYIVESPQSAVRLSQEYLAAIAVISVGLAILMQEIAGQQAIVKHHENSLTAQNLMLEQRVKERTSALNEVNLALQKANAKLAVYASTDELMGISNRRHFLSEVKRELNRLRRDGKTGSAIMVDLDYFKSINDKYGHDAGDEILRAIVAPIQNSIRPRDLFGRMGGEEFLVFLSEADEQLAQTVAERIRHNIASMKLNYRGQDITLTASLGVAQWDGHSEFDDLFYFADKALYQAKNSGRNAVRSASQS